MEIAHRKLSFALALLAVIVAVAYTVSTLTLVRGHRLKTEAHVVALNDEIRKITKNMGFNIDILPKEVNLADFHASDFGEATMPQDVVQKLADSRTIDSVNHLRPSLIRRVTWTERDRDVIVMGVAAVVPWTHRKNPKKPLEAAVPPGKIIVGAVLADQLKLKEEDEITFLGEQLTVAKVHPARGSSDDVTVWIDLAKAQQLLNLPNRINMIQALECNCASIDRLGEVREDIAGVLGGDVQVIERASIALARAETRETVKAQGIASLEELEQTATVETVLLAVGACALVGLLMLSNARERRQEIGILRALGTSTPQIMLLFVGKALVLGVVGALIGYAAGFAMGMRTVPTMAGEAPIELASADLFMPVVLAAVVIAATLLAVLASWIPAIIAAAQDPAIVLREE